MEAAVQTLLKRHREADGADSAQSTDKPEPPLRAKETRRIEKLQTEARRIRAWLTANPNDRPGSRGTIRKSNQTDNESAKMATSKGVIQGYTGVAAVDPKHQVIVEAQAHGTGSEQELLLPVVKSMESVLAQDTLITADAGYHSEANLAALAELRRDALIPDHYVRARDERFADNDKHKQAPDPLHNKSKAKKASARTRLRTSNSTAEPSAASAQPGKRCRAAAVNATSVATSP